MGPVDLQIKLVLPYFESVGLKHNDQKPLIEYSYDTNDIYKNIDEYSPNKKSKTLIVFDNMIADMLYYKILNPNQENYLLEVENMAFLLLSSVNLILLYKKVLD